MMKGVLVRANFDVAEAALGVGEGALEKFVEVGFVEGTEFENLGARNERRVDEEKWIVGGGANEANDATFDIRQKDVLLGFVEAMDFVDEKDGGFAGVFEAVGGATEDAAHVGNVGFNAAEAFEFGFGLAGDNLRQGSFARAGWSEKDERLDAIGFDGAAQELPPGEDVFLADVFVEVARAHACGERGLGTDLRDGGSHFGFRASSEQFGLRHWKRITGTARGCHLVLG